MFPLNTNCARPIPAPGSHHHSTFCLYERDYSKDLIEGESYNICLVCDSFISLHILSSRFIHVEVHARIPLLFNAEKRSTAYVYPSVCVHSSVSGRIWSAGSTAIHTWGGGQCSPGSAEQASKADVESCKVWHKHTAPGHSPPSR